MLHKCNDVVICAGEGGCIRDAERNVLTEVVGSRGTTASNRRITKQGQFVLEFLDASACHITRTGIGEINGCYGSDVDHGLSSCHHSTTQCVSDIDCGNAGVASSEGLDHD